MAEEYSEKMRTAVAQYLRSGRNADDAAREAIESLLPELLRDTKRVGESLESMVYEMLEGVEKGMGDVQAKDVALQQAFERMIEIIEVCAKQDICRDRKRVTAAKAQLDERIAMEKAHLHEALEAFRHYARDTHRQSLIEKLHLLESAVVKRALSLGEKFGYNRRRF